MTILFRNLVITTYVFLHASFQGVGTSSSTLPGIHSFPIKQEGPKFLLNGRTNVTTLVGQTIHLFCHVQNLGDRTVSWIRKRDLHVLTSSIYTFTGDARYSVIHPEGSDEWTLQIKFVQKRDAGVFECQVNTEPKMNLRKLLIVQDRTGDHDADNFLQSVSKGEIVGGKDIYVKTGSMIKLKCIVKIKSGPPGSISWYHNSKLVHFDSIRGGISIETEKTEFQTSSKLVLTKATRSDSGNYSCVPSNAQENSVWVHVINGEHPNALQSADGMSTSKAQHNFKLFLISLEAIIYYTVSTTLN